MSHLSNRIWLSPPHMGGEEEKYVEEAFSTNWIAPLGPNVNGFEEDLKSYIGIKDAGAFISGTASIHLALILLGVKTGDEVICQSFTFSATVNPIIYQGATPVFIDSEPNTWNMDPNLLEEAIEQRLDKLPKAIIVVHLYGMPANMAEIIEIANRYDIPIIEDAAEALGSHIGGKKCGSFGKLNVLSFNGNKIITTSGGGALLSEQEELIKKARFLSTQARDDAPHYQHSNVGYNYRMSNIVAGIGRGQMKVLDDRIYQRRKVHEHYYQNLGATWLGIKANDKEIQFLRNSDTGIYFLNEPEKYFSNRWLSTVIINPDETGGITKEDIRKTLEDNNIEARPLWKPMHQQPIFSNYPCHFNGISDWLFEHGLCLPSGSSLRLDEQNRVIEIIQSLLKKNAN